MITSEAEKFIKTNVEVLTLNEPGGGAYSCIATEQCSVIFPNSTISCTGDNYCKKGLDWVKGGDMWNVMAGKHIANE